MLMLGRSIAEMLNGPIFDLSKDNFFDMMPDGDFKTSWLYMHLSKVVDGEETYHFSHVSEFYYEKHCEAHGI